MSEADVLVQFATVVVPAARSRAYGEPVTPWTAAVETTVRYSFGFRCAYDSDG